MEASSPQASVLLKPASRKADRTRRRILFAAEKLFAEQGIEAVSLRAIAAEVEHRNNNAVQYHFGTKADLIAAIFEERVAQMEAPRGAMLAEADAAGLLDDAHTLMRILCLPHIQLADNRGKHPYAGFMSQYLTRYRPAGMAHAGDLVIESSTNLRRLLALLQARIGYVPATVALSRIALCNLMFINMLVRQDQAPPGSPDAADFDERLHDTLEIATTALCAPYRSPRGAVIGRDLLKAARQKPA